MADKPTPADEPFRPNNTAMLLVDYQTGVLQGVQTQDPTALKNKIVALANMAKLYELPVILTTAAKEGAPRPAAPRTGRVVSRNRNHRPVGRQRLGRPACRRSS